MFDPQVKFGQDNRLRPLNCSEVGGRNLKLKKILKTQGKNFGENFFHLCPPCTLCFYFVDENGNEEGGEEEEAEMNGHANHGYDNAMDEGRDAAGKNQTS